MRVHCRSSILRACCDPRCVEAFSNLSVHPRAVRSGELHSPPADVIHLVCLSAEDDGHLEADTFVLKIRRRLTATRGDTRWNHQARHPAGPSSSSAPPASPARAAAAAEADAEAVLGSLFPMVPANVRKMILHFFDGSVVDAANELERRAAAAPPPTKLPPAVPTSESDSEDYVLDDGGAHSDLEEEVASVPARDSQLPEGWYESKVEGRKCYVHEETGEKTFDRPAVRWWLDKMKANAAAAPPLPEPPASPPHDPNSDPIAVETGFDDDDDDDDDDDYVPDDGGAHTPVGSEDEEVEEDGSGISSEYVIDPDQPTAAELVAAVADRLDALSVPRPGSPIESMLDWITNQLDEAAAAGATDEELQPLYDRCDDLVEAERQATAAACEGLVEQDREAHLTVLQQGRFASRAADGGGKEEDDDDDEEEKDEEEVYDEDDDEDDDEYVPDGGNSLQPVHWSPLSATKTRHVFRLRSTQRRRRR